MYILCVTACPAGVAHTYMAAANLKKAAEKLGVEVKVETQGAGGAEDVINDEDIRKADGVIVAADIAIADEERFDDLPVLECSLSEAIKSSEEIIKELMEGVEA
ncbi:MAG: PTS fructose transporter subunit IIB [Bacillota bacterium]